jgi:Protein of unknown function (DUF3800)
VSYTLYLDESGDRGLVSVNRDYPVLALCGVAIEDSLYSRVVLPRLDTFKVDQFGSASVRLHYRAFTQHAGAFRKLADPAEAWAFENALAGFIDAIDATLFCAVIRKNEYLRRYGPTRPVDAYLPVDLYLMALDFVLERIVKFLEELDLSQGTVIAEARGKREDEQVRAEYRELRHRGTQFVSAERFTRVLAPDLEFRTKNQGVAGLEIADVCAAPIATKVLKPESISPLWEAIRSKVWVGSGARTEGNLGLKCFPRDTGLEELFAGLGQKQKSPESP